MKQKWISSTQMCKWQLFSKVIHCHFRWDDDFWNRKSVKYINEKRIHQKKKKLSSDKKHKNEKCNSGIFAQFWLGVCFFFRFCFEPWHWHFVVFYSLIECSVKNGLIVCIFSLNFARWPCFPQKVHFVYCGRLFSSTKMKPNPFNKFYVFG